MNEASMMGGAPEEELDPETLKQVLDELLEYAHGGQAREMAARRGGGAPPENPPELGGELPAGEGEEQALSPEAEAAEPIPGVEDEPGEPGAEGEMAGEQPGKPDPAKLRALLAQMKSKPTMG